MSLFSIFYARNTCSLSLQSFLYILAIPPVILFGPLIYWIVSVANQVFRLRYPASSLTHAFTEMVSSPQVFRGFTSPSPGFPWLIIFVFSISDEFASVFSISLWKSSSVSSAVFFSYLAVCCVFEHTCDCHLSSLSGI